MGTNIEKTYSVNGVSPAYPVHPGNILGEELKARGISQKKFAETVGLQATHISALIHGTRNFTASVAERVASGLDGISANLWTKLQERYNADMQKTRIRTSSLVLGYNPAESNAHHACLAEPDIPYNGTIQIQLTIPEPDTQLLESLAGRLGWTIQQ